MKWVNLTYLPMAYISLSISTTSVLSHFPAPSLCLSLYSLATISSLSKLFHIWIVRRWQIILGVYSYNSLQLLYPPNCLPGAPGTQQVWSSIFRKKKWGLSTSLDVFFLSKISFYLLESQNDTHAEGEREKEIFHLLGHSLNGRNCWGWTKQNQEPGTPPRSPTWVAAAVFCCVSRCISRELNQGRQNSDRRP